MRPAKTYRPHDIRTNGVGEAEGFAVDEAVSPETEFFETVVGDAGDDFEPCGLGQGRAPGVWIPGQARGLRRVQRLDSPHVKHGLATSCWGETREEVG